MIQILNKELFWKNIDTCALLINALKTQFEEIKLAQSYEILVTTIPPLSQDGLNLLETVYIETEPVDGDDEEVPKEEEPVRQELIKSLKQFY